MITPPITKDDIGRKFRCRDSSIATVTDINDSLIYPVNTSSGGFHRVYVQYNGMCFFRGDCKYDLIERIPIEVTFTPDPAFLKRVSTTNPNEGADPDSGVALLMKHFETNERIYPEQAYRDFGIGRLSARVFDLNQALYERGNQYTIKCVKKDIIKKNGRKARVTDYYQFVEVDK